MEEKKEGGKKERKGKEKGKKEITLLLLRQIS